MTHPVTFISWAPYCSRSDNIARELSGLSHMVYWEALGSTAATVWLKYLGQSLGTVLTLCKERPRAVLVMAPPVVAALPVWLYASVARIPFAIDAHTAAFLHPRWQRLQWLQRALSRRAATTIVTNDHLARELITAGAHVTIVRDVPVRFPTGGRFTTAASFAVAVVCSFNDDEPIEQIVRAAAMLPDVTFYVTGNPKRAAQRLGRVLPDNFCLTGFIPDADYGSLIQEADVVLTLTTRDHTMLRGAYEAIYQGTPVIVSDWPLLQAAFARGAIHVDNSADAIAAAVRSVQRDPERFRTEADELRREKLEIWAETRATLCARLGLLHSDDNA
jgi:glycosyltransferase involved in cell wall biosynthesis